VWQFEAAVRRGLLPGAERGGRWPAEVIEDAVQRLPQILAAVGDQPAVGANRAAERLADRLGVDVDRVDVDALSEQGLLPEAGEYKGWPLYDAVDLDELADRHGDLITAMVAERIAWVETSLHPIAARDRLGLRRDEFDKAVAERKVQPGRLGRFAIADLDALAADEDLVDAIRADRCIGPDQAAQYLEIRRTDFDYLELAGMIASNTTAWMKVGRYRQVPVPLYRIGDLDQLRRHPDVDWEALYACDKGDPSPLRDLLGTRRPPTRAQIIHRFVAELGDRYDIEVWAYYNGATGRWELDWEHLDSGVPTTEHVREAITADPVVAQYRDDIKLSTTAGAAIRWARAMLEPGGAVVLDTETTDLYGEVCEVAVIDASTGETLLNTLVNPQAPISVGAYWIHGITADDVVAAPTWSDVLPKLLEATAGRTILAYNSRLQPHRHHR